MNSAAVLTAPGVAAIAVVRLAGPGTRGFLERHFSKPARPMRPTHGKLLDGQRELDDPVVIWDDSQQTADVCTHGSRWVVHELLELAGREGFEVVACGSGPLPGICVEADDPLEREILEYLPLARTHEALATLLNQRIAWKQLPHLDAAERRAALNDRSLHWLLYPPRIAVIGMPNAGKSTLANALFGQERSIVADLPGTTRDYVSEYANLSGLPVILLDTPGLRTSEDSLEQSAIALSSQQIDSAHLRILLIDPTQDKTPQQQLLARYADALTVAGKADIGAVAWMKADVAVSAAREMGIGELEKAIRRRFECETLPHGRLCAWTQRQREVLEA